MAGPRSPVLLRHLDKVVGFLVPRSKVLFLVPVPRSGSSFLVPVPRSSFRFLVPRSGSSFLVPVPRSNLQIYHKIEYICISIIMFSMDLQENQLC